MLLKWGRLDLCYSSGTEWICVTQVSQIGLVLLRWGQIGFLLLFQVKLGLVLRYSVRSVRLGWCYSARSVGVTRAGQIKFVLLGRVILTLFSSG